MARGRMRVAEIVGLASPWLPEVSHDGTRLAFYWDRTGRIELYVVDLPDGEPQQVSHGEVPRALRAGFVWSPDGGRIVFAKDIGGNEQHDLHSLDLATGTVTKLTESPTAQEDPCGFRP
ncbi:MAG: PD40 domain-containing protein, partial [Candidatus Bipolaricaulota bacterium]